MRQAAPERSRSSLDNLSPEARRRAMQAVKRRDTSDELRLRRALWAAGVRGWRCDVASLPGRPDLAFSRARVAVFVDGGFWHGHPSRFPRPSLSAYWLAKIRRNMERDQRVDAELHLLGWQVVRLWDFEIHADSHGCAQRIADQLRNISSHEDGRAGVPGAGPADGQGTAIP
jgi:DNA mismatch endonuclease (patch repair protein)